MTLSKPEVLQSLGVAFDELELGFDSISWLEWDDGDVSPLVEQKGESCLVLLRDPNYWDLISSKKLLMQKIEAVIDSTVTFDELLVVTVGRFEVGIVELYESTPAIELLDGADLVGFLNESIPLQDYGDDGFVWLEHEFTA